MFVFFSTQIYSNTYIRIQNEQPQIVALFVEGNYKYRLRFIATVQSNNNTDNSFNRKVARIDFIRNRRQKQLVRITKADAASRKHYTIVIRRDIIEGINLDAVRPYKIRLLESNNKNTDEEAERRSSTVPDILYLIN